MIIKTTWLIRKSQRAASVGPFILVRPGSEDDLPLRYHEFEHVRQWWWATFLGIFAVGLFMLGADHLGYTVDEHWAAVAALNSLWLHGVLYVISGKYRLWAELRGHQEEYLRDKRRLNQLAANLSTNYALRLDYATALDLIRGVRS